MSGQVLTLINLEAERYTEQSFNTTIYEDELDVQDLASDFASSLVDSDVIEPEDDDDESVTVTVEVTTTSYSIDDNIDIDIDNIDNETAWKIAEEYGTYLTSFKGSVDVEVDV